MCYLIVENGVIVNKIIAEEAYANMIGAVKSYDGAEIGAEYAPPVAPDIQADMLELLIDQAYRITLLELGVSI